MSDIVHKLMDGLVDLTNKDIATVVRLRKGYSNMVEYFGGRDKIPSTVIKVNRKRIDSERDSHSSEKSCVKMAASFKDERIKSKTMRRLKYISTTGSQKGVLSVFPQDYARTIVLFYTKPGDVVVDPFAGHNSRMEAVARAGRIYYGQDLHHGFMESNIKRAKELIRASGLPILLRRGDSRYLQFPDECGDFGFTCPPYWRIERYDKNDPRQLENAIGGYEGFLVSLHKILREHYRTLKPGAFCVWNVNYFRWQGKFIPFHDDVKRLALKVGFEQWDEIIVDLGRGQRDAFFKSCFKIKKLPKRHEYGLVFRKPSI